MTIGLDHLGSIAQYPLQVDVESLCSVLVGDHWRSDLPSSFHADGECLKRPLVDECVPEHVADAGEWQGG